MSQNKKISINFAGKVLKSRHGISILKRLEIFSFKGKRIFDELNGLYVLW